MTAHERTELAWRGILRALEHQVLEKVRDTGFARRFIGSTDLVPQHLDNRRRPVIFDHHHFQPVRELEVRRVENRGEGRDWSYQPKAKDNRCRPP